VNQALVHIFKKQGKDVQPLLMKVLIKLRSNKKNEAKYQEFLKCQDFKPIEVYVNREIGGEGIHTDIKVVGYRYENDEYIPAYLLHLSIIKSGVTTLMSYSITPAE
jgi:hypothetical protein